MSNRGISWHLICSNVGDPNFRLMATPGGDMRRLIRFVTLLSVVALLSPEYGFAEQPPRRTVVAAGAPSTVVWTARAPAIPPISARSGKMVPTIEARGRAPGAFSEERPGISDIQRDGGADTEVLVNQGAFLLPTWNRGFWVMPPGGLTRFLIPPPGFINPEETLPPDPVIVSSG